MRHLFLRILALALGAGRAAVRFGPTHHLFKHFTTVFAAIFIERHG